MSFDDDSELRLDKTAYDVATLFRVIPWLFFLGDNRAPAALVEQAFYDSEKFISSFVDDPDQGRCALMRGLATNLLRAAGITHNPEMLEMLINLVAQRVDASIVKDISPDGLVGEEA